MSAQDNAKLIQAIVDGWNARNLDLFATVAAVDCEVVDITRGTCAYGPAGYRQFTQELFTSWSPDSKIEVTNLQATADQVLLEFIGRGKLVGPSATATGQLAGIGESYEIRFCNVYEIRNGKIIRVRTYYNWPYS